MNNGDASTQAATPPAPLLTAKQAAAALALGRRKIWSLTASGELPCVRIGKAVRYVPDDLARFVADHRRRAKR